MKIINKNAVKSNEKDQEEIILELIPINENGLHNFVLGLFIEYMICVYRIQTFKHFYINRNTSTV